VQYVGRGGGHLKPLAMPVGPIGISGRDHKLNFLREGGAIC